MVKVINSANFKAEVLDSALPVLVDFYADWCGPCKMMSPSVEEVSEAYAGRLNVGKLNVDDSMDIAAAYQVASIPYMAVFKGGQMVDRIIGAVPKSMLASMVEKYL